MNIEDIIDEIYLIPRESKLKLLGHVKEVEFPKGFILMHADRIERKIYFIKKGIVRAYVYHDGNEITFWFGQEGDSVISMKSYIENKSGYEDIELLEDTELYELDTDILYSLYEKDIHIANWGRKFAEIELIKTEERLISREFRTASERYKELLRDNKDLLKRVQLGHIASYLGITQVSLSRIRAEK